MALAVVAGGLRSEIEALEAKLEALEKKVADLERFRSWVMGIAAGVGAIVAFFAEGLRKKLGIGE